MVHPTLGHGRYYAIAKGCAANWKGLDYQKKFIAFLAVGMLSEDSVIKRITCENVEDVEVEEESKNVYTK